MANLAITAAEVFMSTNARTQPRTLVLDQATTTAWTVEPLGADLANIETAYTVRMACFLVEWTSSSIIGNKQTMVVEFRRNSAVSAQVHRHDCASDGTSTSMHTETCLVPISPVDEISWRVVLDGVPASPAKVSIWFIGII